MKTSQNKTSEKKKSKSSSKPKITRALAGVKRKSTTRIKTSKKWKHPETKGQHIQKPGTEGKKKNSYVSSAA